MTDFKAYDAGLPCKNTSCKSHGQPHPNCRCYADLAEGGEAHFCATDRPHEPGCQYFAEGGDVVPADQVTIDPIQTMGTDTSSVSSVDTSIVPADQVTPDQPVGAGEIVPADQVTMDPETKHFGGSGGSRFASPSSTVPDTDMGAVGAALEGAGQGFAGPLATGVELGLSKLGVPNLTAEDIARREEEHPIAHGLGEAAGLASMLIPGLGEIGLAGKAASLGGKAAEVAKMGKLGSAAIKTFVEGATIAGSDEVTKAMLGTGDPTMPVTSALMHVGAGGLFNMGASSLFHVSGKALSALEQATAKNLGVNVQSFMEGIGFGAAFNAAGYGATKEELKHMASQTAKDMSKMEGVGPRSVKWAQKGWLLGHELRDQTQEQLSHKVSTLAGGAGGAAAGAVFGPAAAGVGTIGGAWLGNKVLSGMVEDLIGPSLVKANAWVFPTMVKIMSNPMTQRIIPKLNYAKSAFKGAELLNRNVDVLFKAGGQAIGNGATTDANRAKLKRYIQEGGLNQEAANAIGQQAVDTQVPQYAKGGEVTDPEKSMEAPTVEGSMLASNGIEDLYPEHNMMLQATKGRVSSYLTGMQPAEHMQKLAFDDDMHDPEAAKSFDKAIDVALNPASVLGHIHSGTLEQEHIDHLRGMYPEMYNQMSKKITERIITAQMSGEKPSYKVRQGLSLFLGTPLDGTMTPENMRAAQAQFAPKQAPQGEPQKKPAHNTKSQLSKMGQQSMTGDQARQARAQKV